MYKKRITRFTQSKIGLSSSQYKTFRCLLNLQIFINISSKDLAKLPRQFISLLKTNSPTLVGDNKVNKTDARDGSKMIKKWATNEIIKKLFKSKILDKTFKYR